MSNLLKAALPVNDSAGMGGHSQDAQSSLGWGVGGSRAQGACSLGQAFPGRLGGQ